MLIAIPSGMKTYVVIFLFLLFSSGLHAGAQILTENIDLDIPEAQISEQQNHISIQVGSQFFQVETPSMIDA